MHGLHPWQPRMVKVSTASTRPKLELPLPTGLMEPLLDPNRRVNALGTRRLLLAIRVKTLSALMPRPQLLTDLAHAATMVRSEPLLQPLLLLSSSRPVDIQTPKTEMLTSAPTVLMMLDTVTSDMPPSRPNKMPRLKDTLFPWVLTTSSGLLDTALVPSPSKPLLPSLSSLPWPIETFIFDKLGPTLIKTCFLIYFILPM